MRSPQELLAAYVEAHNAGVRSGDFAALGDLLLATASMRFRGIDAGPYDSAAAILQAFRDRPPDDELVVSAVRAIDDHTAEAVYAWAETPGQAAGRLRVSTQRDRVSAIRVEVFGRP